MRNEHGHSDLQITYHYRSDEGSICLLSEAFVSHTDHLSLEGFAMIKDGEAYYVTRFLPEPSEKATLDSLEPKGPGTKVNWKNESSKRAAQKKMMLIISKEWMNFYFQFGTGGGFLW